MAGLPGLVAQREQDVRAAVSEHLQRVDAGSVLLRLDPVIRTSEHLLDGFRQLGSPLRRVSGQRRRSRECSAAAALVGRPRPVRTEMTTKAREWRMNAGVRAEALNRFRSDEQIIQCGTKTGFLVVFRIWNRRC